MITNIRTIVLFSLLLIEPLASRAQQILMFVSHEDTYYSEYIVMKEALEAAGYTVDVRSANEQDVSIYFHYGGIASSANALTDSDNTFFEQQFLSLFGTAWDGSHDAVPSTVGVDGSLLDVADMSGYDALVVVGGTGALAYRVDGNYQSQGTAARLIDAPTMQQVAEHLNDLAIDALMQGKPVMAQCHGASIPAFWRVPNTSGPGEEALGYSLIKGGKATGFPESDTAPTLQALDVAFQGVENANGNTALVNLVGDRVTITSPHETLGDNGAGDDKILTTRDWFPQTIAYAARTLLNIIESHPSVASRTAETSVLVLHGGANDPSDCHHTNKENDIPCNHGTDPADLPADYTDLLNVLSNNSAYTDDFTISPTDLDLSESLPFDENDSTSTANYFSTFDVVIFYKHWANYVTDELQLALVGYADEGGGVVVLHHGAYNQNEGGQDKDILIDQLLGVESTSTSFSATNLNYQLFATNYGHFISSHQIDYQTYDIKSSEWNGNALPDAANSTDSYFSTISIYDEIYHNMVISGDLPIGRGVNEITPLFSNDVNGNHNHTSGITHLVDKNLDGTIGRLVYMQPGERQENYLDGSVYGQLIRNAVVWTANQQVNTWTGSAWSEGSTPATTDDIQLTGNYQTSVQSSLEVNNLTVNAGTTLTVASGTYLRINGNLINNGNDIIVESGGSLITMGEVIGENFTIHRNTTFDTNTGRYSIVGAPVDGAAFDVLGTNATIYGYDESEAYNIAGNEGADRFDTPAELGHSTMQTGVGYFSAFTGDANGTISFSGKPHSGTVSVQLSYTDHPSEEDAFEGFNLVANPYPCAIDYSSFMAANNSDIEGAIYLWDDFNSATGRGTNADYVVVNGLGNVDSRSAGLSKWDGNIRSMQGFFVQTIAAGDLQLDFTDAMKVASNNSDGGYFRTANEYPTFKLKARDIDKEYYSETLIGFHPAATTTKDRLDARLFNRTAMKVYSMIDGQPFVIQGLPSDYVSKIPIGIYSEESSTVEFGLEEWVGMDTKQILLTDHTTGMQVNLADQNYNFTSNIGEENDRFSLEVLSGVTGLSDIESKHFKVFQNAEGRLEIHLDTILEEASIDLMDLSGRKIPLRWKQISDKRWMSSSLSRNGIYLLKLTDQNLIHTVKIYLK